MIIKRFPLIQAGASEIRRVLTGRKTLEAVASDIDTICASEKDDVPAASYLPGQLERVTDASIFETKEACIRVVTQREVIHAPTLSYYLPDATIFRGSVYCGPLKIPISGLSKSLDFERWKGASLVSSYTGCRYFGSWLRDDCCTYLLSDGRFRPTSLERPFFPHQVCYEDMFSQNEWRPISNGVFDCLILFQDFSQNSHKRNRYAELRARVKKKITPCDNELVYLRRGASGEARSVANESALIEELAKLGFVVADVETDDLSLLLGKLAGARMVISIEGSHINHCCMTMKSNSCLLVLQPSDRFSSISHGWAAAIGLNYGFVVGTPALGGYQFDIVEVRKTLDLLAHASAV